MSKSRFALEAPPLAGGAVDGDTQGGASSKNSSKSNGSISTTSSNRGLATTAASNEEDLTSTTDGARTGATVVDNRAGGEVVAGGTASAVAMAGGASRPPMLPFRPRAVNSLGNTQGSPSAVPNVPKVATATSGGGPTSPLPTHTFPNGASYVDERQRLQTRLRAFESKLWDAQRRLLAVGLESKEYRNQALRLREVEAENRDLTSEAFDRNRKIHNLEDQLEDLKGQLEAARADRQIYNLFEESEGQHSRVLQSRHTQTDSVRLLTGTPSPVQTAPTTTDEEEAAAGKTAEEDADATESVTPRASASTKKKTKFRPAFNMLGDVLGRVPIGAALLLGIEFCCGATRGSVSLPDPTTRAGPFPSDGPLLAEGKASYMSTASAPTAGGAQVAENSNNGSDPKSDDDDALPFAGGGAVDKVVNTQRGPSGNAEMTTKTTNQRVSDRVKDAAGAALKYGDGAPHRRPVAPEGMVETDGVQVNGLHDEVRPGPQSHQPTTPNGALRGGGSPEHGNHELEVLLRDQVGQHANAREAQIGELGRVGGAGGGRADEGKVDLVVDSAVVAGEASASPMQEGRLTAPELAVGAAGVGGAPAVAEGKKGTQGGEGDSVLVSAPSASPPTSGNAGSSAASVSE